MEVSTNTLVFSARYPNEHRVASYQFDCPQVGFGDLAQAGTGTPAFGQKASFQGFLGSGTTVFGSKTSPRKGDQGADDAGACLSC